jgi:TRAP-type uncharacterized transport system substrate-binding protein
MKNRYRLLFVLGIGLVAAIGLTVAFSLLNPTPSRKIVMSTGPEGSAYAQYAEEYRKHLAKNGIELELRSSGGARENLDRLQVANSDVDLAFITMG